MKNIISRTAFLLSLLSLPTLCFCKTQNTPVSTTYPKAEHAIRLVSYNVGTFSKYVPGCYPLIADLMKELNADVVAMQELDSCTTRNGQVFQIDSIAKLMDWSYVYAPAMPYQGGVYGEGLICRSPILRKFHIALPAGVEPRTVAVAEFDNYIVACTHLDHVMSDAQIQEVEVINQRFTELYGQCNKPVFLLGDMNATPDSPTLQALKKHWKILSIEGYTYSSHEPSMCIDYVLQLKNGAKCQVTDTQIPIRFVSGSVTQASDHLPIYVDVILQPGQ